jgi:hypothetical protein
MEFESEIPVTTVLSTSQRLALGYAKVLQAAESPLPISRYAQTLLASSEGSNGKKAALGVILLLILVIGIPTLLFRPPLIRVIVMGMFLLLVSVPFLFLMFSKFSRRVIWPVGIRILTIDYIVKVMVHQHIRKHLNTLARQYQAMAFALPNEAEYRKPLEETGEKYRKMAEQLQSVRRIIYVSAPPIIATVLSQLQLNWGQIFAAAPFWLVNFAVYYVIYVLFFCFWKKREIFSARATWLAPDLDTEIYALEDSAYDAVRVSKKRELPLDLFLLGGAGAVLVGVALSLLFQGSGPSGGIVAVLGGGRFADSVIPLVGGVYFLWLSSRIWKSRVAAALV